MSGFWLDDDDSTQQKWTLKQIYDDLGSIGDVCKHLDVRKDRLLKWIERRERVKCPYPIKRIGNADVYSLQEWTDWFARWQDKQRARLKDPDDSAWTTRAKPHGSGESFFTYDREK